MTIDPTSDLFKAILSMDSYNRGYNEGITLESGSAVVGTYLGAAQIIQQSDFLTGSAGVNAGFYALAYQLPDDSVTVAYRGTDEDITPTAKDVLHGYGVGAGSADVAQSEMAIQFYKDVAAELNTSNPDPYQADISVTGHSMGGGLAGLVGAIYGKAGALFDNMAFQAAATNLSVYSKGI
jgi:predicted alpha/beta hydrolase